METIPTALKEVLILKPKVFGDPRGFFLESFNKKTFAELGIPTEFAQDNHSRSAKHVLRGLHYQLENPQGKLVRVTQGEIYDVAVDLRKSSPTYGKWVGMTLSETNHQMAWIPPGFAHGFLVLSDTADVLYKATTFYHQPSDRSILWSDQDINITWPITVSPLVSEKDAKGKRFKEAESYG